MTVRSVCTSPSRTGRSSVKSEGFSRPYLIFYATRTTLISSAVSELDAYARFIDAEFPAGRSNDRLVPPTRDECTVRLLRPQDRDWIYDAHNGEPPKVWRRALERVSGARNVTD